MSIDAHPSRKPLVPPAGPSWGILGDDGARAPCIRFVLPHRVVTFAADQLTRWEHHLGDPERLSLTIAGEVVNVEGFDLAPIRSALDQGRLVELRLAREPFALQGPRIRKIVIESATKRDR